ncbi:topoisomerase II medium subunit [Acinetobacter phage SH-Ab 15599]|nr:topoisomerase II medium subunit [Acinetobacter phage SH-Ab 15599]
MFDVQIVPINEFIENDFKPYVQYDNERSIPSAVDGLKMSQRKVIYTVMKEIKEGESVKVNNLASFTSSKTHYQHGESSLIESVIGLAQDFAGANNYPLLQKEGQFGTAIDNRATDGRYIFVRRTTAIDEMFDEDDLSIINYKETDGDEIEPDFFLPKLPLILINGGFGIGFGYSSNILPRNILNIKKAIAAYLTSPEKEIPEKFMIPSFNGFKGTVVQAKDPKQFIITGVIERNNQTTTTITDLPPFSPFQYEKYKQRVLLPLLTSKKIVSFDDESTEGNWKIIIRHSREFGKQTIDKLHSIFKLNSSFTENINVWGFDNCIKSFDSATDLLKYWIEERLWWIQVRKNYKLELLEYHVHWYESLIKYIKFWLANPELLKKKRPEIESELRNIVDNDALIKRFLESDILALTDERIERVQKLLQKAQSEYNELEKKTPEFLLAADIESVKV